MCLCVCVCVCACVCLCVCVCACVCVCVHLFCVVLVCVRIRVCVCHYVHILTVGGRKVEGMACWIIETTKLEACGWEEGSKVIQDSGLILLTNVVNCDWRMEIVFYGTPLDIPLLVSS